jgi:hypothetical protein
MTITSPVRQPNNNIDRLPAYDDPMVRLNLVEVNRRKRSRSPMRNDSHLPKAAAIPTGGKGRFSEKRLADNF